IVYVHSDNGVTAERRRASSELVEGQLARTLQLALVGAGTAADDVAQTRQQILEQVRTQHRLARDDAAVPRDPPPFDGVRGRDQHCDLLELVGQWSGRS